MCSINHDSDHDEFHDDEEEEEEREDDIPNRDEFVQDSLLYFLRLFLSYPTHPMAFHTYFHTYSKIFVSRPA